MLKIKKPLTDLILLRAFFSLLELILQIFNLKICKGERQLFFNHIADIS